MHVITELLGAGGSSQSGQDDGVGEPLRVVGVMDQYRGAGGGPQHP